ncbi:MAG TPA: hypothetical protein VFU41_01215 [Gemmatimonadales bacterium]|nr:hypothetical protein [Gemmatimonadales bacterium]
MTAPELPPPPQAIVALVWAIVGPPLLLFAATRVRRGRIPVHVTLMIVSVVIELAVFVGFSFLMAPSPRRPALMALPIFKIHLAFAVTTLGGIAWQVVSRATPKLRPLHRHTGPYVLLVWCLALLTGIYNYVFLYVLRGP